MGSFGGLEILRIPLFYPENRAFTVEKRSTISDGCKLGFIWSSDIASSFPLVACRGPETLHPVTG